MIDTVVSGVVGGVMKNDHLALGSSWGDDDDVSGAGDDDK